MHAGRKPVSSSRRLMAGTNPFPYRRKHGTHTSRDRSGHGLFDPTGDTERRTHAGAQSRGFRHPGRRKHRGHGTVRFRQIDVTARTRQNNGRWLSLYTLPVRFHLHPHPEVSLIHPLCVHLWMRQIVPGHISPYLFGY